MRNFDEAVERMSRAEGMKEEAKNDEAHWKDMLEEAEYQLGQVKSNKEWEDANAIWEEANERYTEAVTRLADATTEFEEATTNKTAMETEK